MKKDVVYSSSLKKMIGLKLFPNINPESLQQKKISNLLVTPDLLKNKQTQPRINDIKKKMLEKKKFQKSFEDDIDEILYKMNVEGKVDMNTTRVGQRRKPQHLRIVSETNEDGKSIELPHLQSQSRQSLNKLGGRLKTQVCRPTYSFSNKKIQDDQIVNVGRYLKHYREGLSSLKKLKLKK